MEKNKEPNYVYFQPKGIKPQYCEVGMIHESDAEYIWYLDEPCKILISEVKIIPKDKVTYDEKNRTHMVTKQVGRPKLKREVKMKRVMVQEPLVKTVKQMVKDYDKTKKDEH